MAEHKPAKGDALPGLVILGILLVSVGAAYRSGIPSALIVAGISLLVWACVGYVVRWTRGL